MISIQALNLAVIGATFILLLIYLVKFTLQYKHTYESNPLVTLTVLFSLLVVLTTAFVLPLDIFLVSFIKEPDGTFKSWATNETLSRIDQAVFGTYYVLYGTTALLVFVVLPFLHFFNEESESNSSDRLFSAVKYTFGSLMLVILLFLLGAFITNDYKEPNTIFDKIPSVKNETKFQSALTMVLTVITLAGFVNVTFYTASGLFSWPIGLIFGTKSSSSRYTEIQERCELLRLQLNRLQEKARTDGLSEREQEKLNATEEELRQLDQEEIILLAQNSSISYKLRKIIRPVQIISGLFFGVISILLVVTLLIVNIDRILNSTGPKQGYVLLQPTIFNPLEQLYVKFQNLYVIGPIPFLIVNCLLVVATISGIRNLGLWLILSRVYQIKLHRTPPQALLYFCATIVLTVTAFSLILYSMTSHYVTFGNQNFIIKGLNGTSESKTCTIESYQSECILTRSSVLIMRMMSQIWVFGAIFFWWSWAFIVVATVSLIGYLKRGKRRANHDTSLEDEFED